MRNNDLISRKAAIEMLQRLFDEPMFQHPGEDFYCGVSSAMCGIDEIPAVDALSLRCRIGDTVWIVGDRFPAEIEEIRIAKDGVFFVYAEYDRGYELTELWDDGEFQAEDIGKTVFLTLDEYEAAFEERKQNDQQ